MVNINNIVQARHSRDHDFLGRVKGEDCSMHTKNNSLSKKFIEKISHALSNFPCMF